MTSILSVCFKLFFEQVFRSLFYKLVHVGRKTNDFKKGDFNSTVFFRILRHYSEIL